jgi:hypothetical protein
MRAIAVDCTLLTKSKGCALRLFGLMNPFPGLMTMCRPPSAALSLATECGASDSPIADRDRHRKSPLRRTSYFPKGSARLLNRRHYLRCGAPTGKRNGRYRPGDFTKADLAERCAVSKLVRFA